MWQVEEGQSYVMCFDPSLLCTDLLLPMSILDEVDMLFPHYRFALVVQKNAVSSPPPEITNLSY